ncbi:MAG: SPOR domain-containing protein [bacterium]
MDYRSASQSHGTSPLKAAGLLVGLLIVVALAFALGMKAGHELDLLRRDEGAEPSRVAEREGRAAEQAHAGRDGATAPKRGGEGAGGARNDPEPASSEPPTTKPTAPVASETKAPVSSAPAPATSVAAAAAPSVTAAPSTTASVPHGERGSSAASSTKPEAASVAKVTPPVPTPAVDYGMFRSTAGSPSPKPASEAEGSRAGTAATPVAPPVKAPTPTAPTPPKTDVATAARDARDTNVAVAKPLPPVTPKKPEAPRDARSASAPKLTIAPEAPPKAPKPDEQAAPGFVIQVAELDSKTDADQLLTRLKAHGIQGTAARVDLPSGPHYRVRVGRYKTMADAKAAQKKVAAAGFGGAAIVSSR